MSNGFDPAAGARHGPELNDCGCCAGLGAETPRAVLNRPGLAAISYRVGDHAAFKRSLLARLSASGLAPLRHLNRREDDDFSIALLDAWAVMADVLTFYQERIANESYLGTATERVSLLHLARLIGYELRPGVAASAWLAFTVDSPTPPAVPGVPLQPTPNAPSFVAIGKGTKVQSTPLPGQQAQLYETIEAIEARPEWNAMKPRLTQPHPLHKDLESVTVPGPFSLVKAGDTLLIARGADRAFPRVLRLTPDQKTETTRLDLKSQPAAVAYPAPALSAGQFIYQQKVLSNQFVSAALTTGKIWLQHELTALAAIQRWSTVALAANINATSPVPPAESDGVFAFRVRAGLFGHNAPRWDSLPSSQRKGEWILRRKADGSTETPPFEFVPASYPVNWEGRTLTEDQLSGTGIQVDLDQVHSGVLRDSWIVLESPSARRAFRVASNVEVSRSDFGISAKVSRLTLYETDRSLLTGFTLRETTVHAQSETLELAPVPLPGPIEGDTILLDRAQLELKKARPVAITGELHDLKGVVQSEVRTIAEITLEENFTRLKFTEGLRSKYRLDTVILNANVVPATHGETKSEVLGSGDATQPFQTFALRQPPLTHVTAPTPSGGRTTLELRVNDVLWHEVPSFHGHGPTERIFVTRRADTGSTSVQFGDGKTGARLPTGQENVRAVYRRGIGLGGLVPAGQLNLLLTRPLGVREAVNPLDADGAADPEPRDQARRNAPLTVLTLDRIVSLQDYEDFANAFSGIAKALATWTWNGEKRGVCLTVAGPNGAVVSTGSRVFENLLGAIKKAGDPLVLVEVKSFRPAPFNVAAGVKVEADFRRELVLQAVQDALRGKFSFEARRLGQPVFLSEVIAAMQAVEGVEAVNVTALHRTGTVPEQPPPPRLVADFPRAGAAIVAEGAELLTLDPSPLTEVGVLP